jgi:hypothetical protein
LSSCPKIIKKAIIVSQISFDTTQNPGEKHGKTD